MTYLTVFRCFLDFTCVKIIKDYSLTQQTERSTYSRRSAQKFLCYFSFCVAEKFMQEKTHNFI